MPWWDERLPEQSLQHGMGEVDTSNLHPDSHQGQEEVTDEVSAAGSGLMRSKVQPHPHVDLVLTWLHAETALH